MAANRGEMRNVSTTDLKMETNVRKVAGKKPNVTMMLTNVKNHCFFFQSITVVGYESLCTYYNLQ
jgi:hypothetical protein